MSNSPTYKSTGATRHYIYTYDPQTDEWVKDPDNWTASAVTAAERCQEILAAAHNEAVKPRVCYRTEIVEVKMIEPEPDHEHEEPEPPAEPEPEVNEGVVFGENKITVPDGATWKLPLEVDHIQKDLVIEKGGILLFQDGCKVNFSRVHNFGLITQVEEHPISFDLFLHHPDFPELMDMGEIKLVGRHRSMIKAYLNAHAEKGDTTIGVDREVDWKPGDVFFLSGSEYVPEETEECKVLKVEGFVVTLIEPLKHAHCGEIYEVTRNGRQIEQDERAVVQNTEFGINIFSANDNHQVMFMHSDKPAYLEGVAVWNGGNPKVRGIYPFHFHEPEGRFIHLKNCISIGGFRAVAFHNCQKAVIEDFHSINGIGHQIYFEDALAEGNTVNGATISGVFELPTTIPYEEFIERSDRMPAGVWMKNPNNCLMDVEVHAVRGNGHTVDTRDENDKPDQVLAYKPRGRKWELRIVGVAVVTRAREMQMAVFNNEGEFHEEQGGGGFYSVGWSGDRTNQSVANYTIVNCQRNAFWGVHEMRQIEFVSSGCSYVAFNRNGIADNCVAIRKSDWSTKNPAFHLDAKGLCTPYPVAIKQAEFVVAAIQHYNSDASETINLLAIGYEKGAAGLVVQCGYAYYRSRGIRGAHYDMGGQMDAGTVLFLINRNPGENETRAVFVQEKQGETKYYLPKEYTMAISDTAEVYDENTVVQSERLVRIEFDELFEDQEFTYTREDNKVFKKRADNKNYPWFHLEPNQFIKLDLPILPKGTKIKMIDCVPGDVVEIYFVQQGETVLLEAQAMSNAKINNIRPTGVAVVEF